MRSAYPLALVVGGAVALSGCGGGSDAAQSPPAAKTQKATAGAPCSSGGAGTTRVSSSRDVEIGPLVLLGGQRWAASKPNAFNRHGYKVPVTLPEGLKATLSVPAAMRGHVGLVYSQAAQGRVEKKGVRGADVSVRFAACPIEGPPGKTGWAGGIVVDRPRCATLKVEVVGGGGALARVPLGRRC
jgi:hypothetical protein